MQWNLGCRTGIFCTSSGNVPIKTTEPADVEVPFSQTAQTFRRNARLGSHLFSASVLKQAVFWIANLNDTDGSRWALRLLRLDGARRRRPAGFVEFVCDVGCKGISITALSCVRDFVARFQIVPWTNQGFAPSATASDEPPNPIGSSVWFDP